MASFLDRFKQTDPEGQYGDPPPLWQSNDVPDLYEYVPTPGGGTTLNINLHPGQREALEATRPIILVCAGHQSGKTSFAPIWLYSRMQAYGPGDYAAVSPNFPLMDTKLLPSFISFFEDALQVGKYMPSKKAMRITPDGERRLFGFKQRTPTIIHFRSADNEESLESFTAQAIVADEFGQEKVTLKAWDAIQRRVRIARGRGMGQIYIPTTPYAFGGWFYFDLYRPAMDEKNGHPTEKSEEIHMINFASTMNPRFPQEEYDKAKRTLPSWKFEMMFNGRYVRPAGLIYQDFRDTPASQGGHLLPPSTHLLDTHNISSSLLNAHLHDPRSPHFRITWDHPRATGIDFGSVNMAIVSAALSPNGDDFNSSVSHRRYDPKDPSTWPFVVIYRSHHLSGYSAQESARFMSKQTEGEPKHRCWGGAASEHEYRAGFREGGFPVAEPPLKDVEAGIDRVIALIKADRLFVCEDQRGWLEQALSYQRKLDDMHEPTDEIRDKKAFHHMDATRYLAVGLTSNRGARPVGERLGQMFGR